VIIIGSDGNNTRSYLFRCASIHGGAVTQLTTAVAAHGPECAIVFDKQTMLAASSNSDNTRGDLHRGASIRGGAITELAAIISSHSPERAIVFNLKTAIGLEGQRPGPMQPRATPWVCDK